MRLCSWKCELEQALCCYPCCTKWTELCRNTKRSINRAQPSLPAFRCPNHPERPDISRSVGIRCIILFLLVYVKDASFFLFFSTFFSLSFFLFFFSPPFFFFSFFFFPFFRFFPLISPPPLFFFSFLIPIKDKHLSFFSFPLIIHDSASSHSH